MEWVVLICGLAAVRFLRWDSPFLPAAVIIPIAWPVAKSIARKEDIFSPGIFFLGFYLLWMGGGYAACFYRRSFGLHLEYSQVAFLILLAFFALLLGLRLPVLRISSSGISGTAAEPRRIDAGYRRLMWIAVPVIVAGLAFNALFYLAGALTTLLGGLVEETRVAMIYGRGYLYHLARSINIVIPIYLGSKWYCGKKWNRLDYLLLLTALALIAFPLSRRPLLWFVITMVILHHYLRKPLPVLKAIPWLIAVMAASLVLLIIRLPGTVFGSRLVHELGVHVWNISLYLRNIDLLGGQKFTPFLMNLEMVLPGHQPDFGLWLKETLELYFLGGGISVTLIGEGMLSFGVAGVAAEGFLTGYALKLAYHFFRRRFSLRGLFIYVIALTRCAEVINYGIAMALIPTLYEIGLVLLIIPARLYWDGIGYESSAGQ